MMNDSSLEDILYNAVHALITREMICNNVMECSPEEKEEAIKVIVKKLLLLFEE